MARYFMEDESCLRDEISGRSFFIQEFYSYDSRGRQRDCLGYEVHEHYHVTDGLGKKLYSANYTVLQYENVEDARFFLHLLKWVLNEAHTWETYSCVHVGYLKCSQLKACVNDISKHIWNILIHAPIDEIAERHERNEKLFKKIREAKHPELTRIYAMLFDNNCVKIGFSKDVYARANTLKIPPLEIPKFAYTKQCYTVERARQIESECHKFFSSRRRINEYFNISFEEACEKLKTYSDIFIDELGL